MMVLVRDRAAPRRRLSPAPRGVHRPDEEPLACRGKGSRHRGDDRVPHRLKDRHLSTFASTVWHDDQTRKGPPVVCPAPRPRTAPTSRPRLEKFAVARRNLAGSSAGTPSEGDVPQTVMLSCRA